MSVRQTLANGAIRYAQVILSNVLPNSSLDAGIR